MFGWPVKFLSLGFCFLAIFTLPGCGKPGGGEGGGEPLRVSVEIPAGEIPELFWFGVENKRLQVSHDGKLESVFWAAGQTLDLPLAEEDTLVFEGLDSQGRLLVTGEAMVGKAKLVSIPIRRVL